MLKKTPLNKIHKQLGAKMVDFGGWEMPVQYSGIREEHRAVRERAGLFDISHMGEIVISGPGAYAAAQFLSCNDLNRLSAGRCQYSALLTDEGTFVDDIIVYPIAADHIFICVNAANTEKDYQWIRDHAAKAVSVHDESSHWFQLAIQGPEAVGVVQQLTDARIAELSRFAYAEITLGGISTILSRTGYTGEDGFEIYGAAADAETLWQALTDAGREVNLLPCGLGARDTLRLEACYPLYGHEIDDTINPYEAGLGWIVSRGADNYIGKAALEKIRQGESRRRLIAFIMDERHIPRADYSIWASDQRIGQVVSGTYSPTLERGIGLAYVPPEFGVVGAKIDIDIRGKKRKATIVPRPFYRAP